MLEDVETNLMDDRSWIEKLIGVVIRDSNEGYPKVCNHGEGPYYVERPWGQRPFSIVS